MPDKWDGGRRRQPAGERSHAFLLRCWLEPGSGPDGASIWRFSLTLIDKRREPKGFTELEAVLAHLNQILMENSSTFLEGEQS